MMFYPCDQLSATFLTSPYTFIICKLLHVFSNQPNTFRAIKFAMQSTLKLSKQTSVRELGAVKVCEEDKAYLLTIASFFQFFGIRNHYSPKTRQMARQMTLCYVVWQMSVDRTNVCQVVWPRSVDRTSVCQVVWQRSVCQVARQSHCRLCFCAVDHHHGPLRP